MFSDTDLLNGDITKRDRWLHNLLAHMKSCGWIAQPCSEWDDGDIEVLGPGPYTLKLTSVYEEDLQRAMHHIRFRITPKLKLYAPIVVAVLMASLIGIPLGIRCSSNHVRDPCCCFIRWGRRRRLGGACS